MYDIHIQLSGVPLLPWEPPPLSYNIYASEVMSHPVVTFSTVESVKRIVDVLKMETYNGFPVVDPHHPEQVCYCLCYHRHISFRLPGIYYNSDEWKSVSLCVYYLFSCVVLSFAPKNGLNHPFYWLRVEECTSMVNIFLKFITLHGTSNVCHDWILYIIFVCSDSFLMKFKIKFINFC